MARTDNEFLAPELLKKGLLPSNASDVFSVGMLFA